ncbi:upf0392 protein rcom_0530710 [Phtheirospermum japonicum]|uniref:Glycosyltransferase family 92 protein n=1 Tax=Phtheirospermum japonicum TaxID=374723 RepID=A0A830C392_9LAMI|nr:upf0392 protein rcom_0530710 [Phtheirospermum japonicum]
MKDRRKRTVLSWGLFCLWCTIVILCFARSTFSTLRLLFIAEGFNPRLVPTWNIPAMEAVSSENPATPAISIQQTVIFPDEALVFLKYPPSSSLFTKDAINCIYLPPNSSQPQLELSPSSVDFDYDNHQIVRCPLPPRGAIPSLAVKPNVYLTPGPTYKWDSLAYEAVIDRDNTTVVFVKGLNLRSGKAADPSKFKCVYGQDLTKSKFVLPADVVSVAQEIVRCKTPLSILNSPQTFSSNNDNPIKVSVRFVGRRPINSIARVKNNKSSPKPLHNNKQHEMCVCTMLRNQARFLREWVTYHSRIGVDRYFIYDNNSDDDIERVVDSLAGDSYNVTRHLWPWIKTQEAGFAHCALKARDSCEWVGFIDVDEFLHLPSNLSLQDVVKNQTRPSDVAELRISCHNFGPSGLKEVPARGVMVGYTCRMVAPERHKSIVRPEALNSSLINVVHHFHLKTGFRHLNVNRSVLVINHYKYQVWEVFKEKFRRRVATYVSDWQQERNVGSKDRAPGLGTKAVEPSDWSTRFCEVRDTGLRKRVLEDFTDPETGLLPWEDWSDLRNKT